MEKLTATEEKKSRQINGFLNESYMNTTCNTVSSSGRGSSIRINKLPLKKDDAVFKK